MDDHEHTEPPAATGPRTAPLDLTAASAQVGLASRTRLVRWWIAATIAAVVVALAAGAYAAYTYESARSWQDTAGDWRQHAETLEAELDTLQAERDDLADALADTETELADTDSDLRDAEDRLADVTAEREAARDTAALRADEIDLATTVGNNLSVCVDDLFDWLASTPSYTAPGATWDAYFDAGDAIAAVCGQAQGDFDAFVQTLQSVNR